MPNPTFSTLEEAQAEILRLNEELETTRSERDSYSTRTSELSAELESVRKINQQYFLKLSAQYSPTPQPEDEPQEALSCEEFAKTINI